MMAGGAGRRSPGEPRCRSGSRAGAVEAQHGVVGAGWDFRSDNLVSNEMYMQRVIPELMRIAKPGRAYLGVGPEQNFTYIAAVKPAIAFIVDIRRGNCACT